MGVAVTAAIGATAISAGAGDPVDHARDRVSGARAAADEVSTRYFAALEEFESLAARIDAAGAEIEQLEERTDGLRDEVRRRAVVAYRSAGSSPLDLGQGGLDSARRAALLGELNERDEQVVDDLEAGVDELEDQQAELQRARAEQEGALDALRAEQAELDAVLADAQGDYAARVTARAARRVADPAPAVTPGPGTPAAPPPDEPAPTVGPAAPPAPPPTSGGVHPHHDDPFLSCTRARESGGNYQAVNPAGPYLGAYQFLQSTWNSTANHAGRPGLIGVDPRNASQYDQDDMAWTLYQWQGKGPWGGYC